MELSECIYFWCTNTIGENSKIVDFPQDDGSNYTQQGSFVKNENGTDRAVYQWIKNPLTTLSGSFDILCPIFLNNDRKERKYQVDIHSPYFIKEGDPIPDEFKKQIIANLKSLILTDFDELLK